MTSAYPPEHPLFGMTQEKWDSLKSTERDHLRDLSGLSTQLIGLEGKRVEVCYQEHGRHVVRRFWVGRSFGWRPCHVEISRRNAKAGEPARERYVHVRVLSYTGKGWT